MKKIFLLFFLACSTTGLAQNQHKADSIRGLLDQRNLSDSLKLRFYKDLAIYEGSPDLALSYAQDFLALAQEMKLSLKEAEAFEEISLIQRKLGNLEEATDAALKALAIYEDSKEHNRSIAVITQLANSSVAEGQYKEAIKGFLKAYRFYQKEADTLRTAYTLLNLGETYRLDTQYDSAAYYLEEALQLNTSGDQIIRGYGIGNLGLVFHNQGNHQKAVAPLEESIEILSKLGDRYSVSVYTFELGKALLELNQSALGEKKMLKAYQIAKTERLKEQIRDFSEGLAGYYQANRNFRKAFTYQKEYQVYKDSLINIDNVRRMEQLKGQYAVNERESEISFLSQINENQQRTLLWLLAGASLLAILLTLLYINNQQKKRANRLIAKREQEKALLLQELNHRTKNNLQMISSLLRLQAASLEGQPGADAMREGKNRVDSLALMHQKLYKIGSESIDMKQYLKELIDSLSESFDPDIVIDLDLDSCRVKVDTAIPLALITNELITNSLKYGQSLKEPSRVQLTIKQNDKGYDLSISDNGEGMDIPDLNKLKSFGLKLVYSLANQIQAQIDYNNTNGSKWNIAFNNG